MKKNMVGGLHSLSISVSSTSGRSHLAFHSNGEVLLSLLESFGYRVAFSFTMGNELCPLCYVQAVEGFACFCLVWFSLSLPAFAFKV